MLGLKEPGLRQRRGWLQQMQQFSALFRELRSAGLSPWAGQRWSQRAEFKLLKIISSSTCLCLLNPMPETRNLNTCPGCFCHWQDGEQGDTKSEFILATRKRWKIGEHLSANNYHFTM